MYAQLSDSYQWSILNKNSGLTDKIQQILSTGTIVTVKDIPSTILKLRNRSRSPLTTKIIDSINNGDIILIYAKGIKIPIYLPFIISQMGPHLFRGYVFLNNLDAVQGEAEIELSDKKFKVAMESCYLSLRIRQIGDSAKLRSNAILRSGSKIYASIITDCINRKHNIKLDLNIYNALLAIFTRYYITTMLGIKNLNQEVLDSYCYYNCKDVDLRFMKRVFDELDPQDFNNIGVLINKLPQLTEFKSRLSKLTVTNFLENYINMFDASMLLGLEIFPYFLYNILAVNDATYINNYQVLKNHVGDDGKKIYADLIVAVD